MNQLCGLSATVLTCPRIATKQQFQMNSLEALEGHKNADALRHFLCLVRGAQVAKVYRG